VENSCSNTSSRSSNSGDRDLEPYTFEEATASLANLDLTKTGWSVEDMLTINEVKYGYKSTFNTDMSEYTMPVRRENTAEFRRREAEAERLAREIESDYHYKLNVDKELSDGEDEELAFSAVHRDSSRHHGSKSRSAKRGQCGGGSNDISARQRKSSNRNGNRRSVRNK
jgi:PAB1-binding protein PBP1